MVALVVQQVGRRQDLLERRRQSAAEKPTRDWDLSAKVLASAEEMHAAMREEMERWRTDSMRLRAELQAERSAFQIERKEMLLERTRWAEERSGMVLEIESGRKERHHLEGQVEGLQRRVQILEQKLRDLGHDPGVF